MVYFRPFFFIIILTFLSVLMCGVTSLLGANHPLIMMIFMLGGMLGILMLMDYIDGAFLH